MYLMKNNDNCRSDVTFTCKKSGAGGAQTYCDPDMAKCATGGSSNAPNPRWCSIDSPLNGSGAYFADVSTLQDATTKLRYAAKNRNSTGQPFFLGVGIRKPRASVNMSMHCKFIAKF